MFTHKYLAALFRTLLLLLIFNSSTHADSIVITPHDIRDALTSASNPTDYLQQAVNSRIRSALESEGIGLAAGALIYTDILPADRVNDGCNPIDVGDVQLRAAVGDASRLSMDIQSLHDPLILSLNLNAELRAEGSAKQTIGVRLGDCQELGSDRFSFRAAGPFELGLTVTLSLNPVLYEQENRLVLNPEVSVVGGLTNWSVDVDVDDSLFRHALERYLKNEISDALSVNRIAQAIDFVEQALQQQLSELTSDDGLVIDLPAAGDPQIDALYDRLKPDADFSLSIAYTSTRRTELLAAIITGDQEWMDEFVDDTALCEASSILQIDLPHAPLYTAAEGSCAKADPVDTESASGFSHSLYLDDQCLHATQVDPVSAIDFCTVTLDPKRLGNAASFPEQLGRWQLSPGNQFDIGAATLTGLEQPFMQRVQYKQVETPSGLCQLEMRIYSEQPGQEPGAQYRPLLALHGGSWQHRSSGFIGIESMATQFVDHGFVVFAPFYRLLGTDEGNSECQQADFQDIVEDAYDALDWVVANQSVYDATGKVSVFGQSAGGHLGAMLTVRRSEQIERAALFYAPTDFADFLEGLQSGRHVTSSGTRILESVLDQPLESISITDTLLQQNRFPHAISQMVAEENPVPPLFLLHGEQDTLLPFRQSVRVCNALGGNPDVGIASLSPNTSSARRVYDCDDQGSQLHLIAQGQHALDLCIAEELCLAGDRVSAQLTTDSVNDMLDWMERQRLLEQAVFLDEPGTSSGSSNPLLLMILSLISFSRTRNRVPVLCAQTDRSGNIDKRQKPSKFLF